MFARLFLLFTLVPLVELALLIRIGEWVGALPTVALVATTGLVGAWLARREGTRSWTAVREELSAGRVPGRELLHTLMIVIAGALLVTPGVLTDAAGLLLLLRPFRNAAIDRVRGRLEKQVSGGGIRFFYGARSGTADPRAEESGRPDGADRERAGPDGDDADGGTGSGWHRRRAADGEDDSGGERGRGRIVEM